MDRWTKISLQIDGKIADWQTGLQTDNPGHSCLETNGWTSRLMDRQKHRMTYKD